MKSWRNARSTNPDPLIFEVPGYLLDTNVLSELLKKRPEPRVVRSLNVRPRDNPSALKTR